MQPFCSIFTSKHDNNNHALWLGKNTTVYQNKQINFVRFLKGKCTISSSDSHI